MKLIQKELIPNITLGIRARVPPEGVVGRFLLSVPSCQCYRVTLLPCCCGGSYREILTLGQTLWVCSLENWCLEQAWSSSVFHVLRLAVFNL